MFVTPQDFLDLPYNLPKMNDAATSAAMVKFINRNEPIELRIVLGSDFYNSLVAGFSALPPLFDPTKANYNMGDQVVYSSDLYQSLVNNPPVNSILDNTKWMLLPPNRWAKLAYGEDFLDINQAKENWIGLKELVKPLIYGLWLRDDIDTSVQSGGVVQQQMENSNRITSAIRFSDALENYSLKVGKWENCEVDTLYNYLYNNSAKFNNDVGANIAQVNGDFKNYLMYYFTNPGYINDFGI